jgi:phage baseplate assembly protein W
MSTINIKFPLQDNPEKGYLFKMNELTNDAVKSDLLLLMLTQKGERYYNPDYGTNLKKFIFEPNDDLTEFDIKEQIKTDVKKYLPNVNIGDIIFIKNELGMDDREILVTVKFTYGNSALEQSDQLVIKF